MWCQLIRTFVWGHPLAQQVKYTHERHNDVIQRAGHELHKEFYFLQLTFSLDMGWLVNLWAVTRYMSGAGFPSFTSASSEHTAWEKQENSSFLFDIFTSYVGCDDPVQIARGILWLWRWFIRTSAPACLRNFGKSETGIPKTGDICLTSKIQQVGLKRRHVFYWKKLGPES